MKEDNYIKRFIDLSISLAKADFVLRNEGTYLGLFWYLLNPILLFALLYLIFYDRLGHNIPYYGLYLYIGIIMFNFFTNCTLEATKSIIGNNKWLIKSINFPRESLVASISLKYLFSHFIEMTILVLILIYYNLNLVNIFYYLPIVFLMFIFVFGFSLIFASLTVYFVDLDNIWAFTSRLIWFLTPIFYAVEGQKRLLFINLFNPMYYYITLAREILISSVIDWNLLMIAFMFSVVFLLTGLIIFISLKPRFAESI